MKTKSLKRHKAFPGTSMRSRARSAAVHRRMILGSEVLELTPMSMAYARSNLPKLLRLTRSGEVFEICGAKEERAPTAVLIGLDVIRQHSVTERHRRTLRDLLDSLPFKRHGNPLVRADLPDDDAPRLRVQVRVSGK
jgi:hypothetical protein